MKRIALIIVALGLCVRAAAATPLAENDDASRPVDMMPAETLAPANVAPSFEPSDPELPVGKTVALPTHCMSADQEAVRALERQGELLDADPTLFAESFNTLV